MFVYTIIGQLQIILLYLILRYIGSYVVSRCYMHQVDLCQHACMQHISDGVHRSQGWSESWRIKMNDFIKKGVQEIMLTADALCELLPEKV